MTQALDLPTMQELRVSNDLFDRPEELRARLAQDGYVFLRDVLDQEAVAEARRAFLEVLAQDGHVASAEDTTPPRYTGPRGAGRRLDLSALDDQGVWQRLVHTPSVNAVFETVMGDEVAWVPIVEYRATPPAPEPPADPFAGRHQDGYFNEGMAFHICWIPLSEIDRETGGIALATGLHHGPFLHDPSLPNCDIPQDAIPADCWRRADYRPGDLIVFSRTTPHAGLANRSGDGLRLSLDLRVIPLSEPVPLVGPLVEVGEASVTVDDARSGPTTVVVDETTVVRAGGRDTVPLSYYRPGDVVIVPHRDGRAVNLRPGR